MSAIRGEQLPEWLTTDIVLRYLTCDAAELQGLLQRGLVKETYLGTSPRYARADVERVAETFDRQFDELLDLLEHRTMPTLQCAEKLGIGSFRAQRYLKGILGPGAVLEPTRLLVDLNNEAQVDAAVERIGLGPGASKWARERGLSARELIAMAQVATDNRSIMRAAMLMQMLDEKRRKSMD